MSDDLVDKGKVLRRGWTTGACATAATKAALRALLGDGFPDPVEITLPRGQTVGFTLAEEMLAGEFAEAAIIKDAGDDPDVTHGALIRARVAWAAPGTGVTFRAGEGVGMVTRPGLPVAVGEPAINPVPREMIRAVVAAEAQRVGRTLDVTVTLSVRDGARLAEQTWNPRLGIVGGLSILGTTGIVVPYSCSAWIHSIHRGVDVARAMGLEHVVGATGHASEEAARRRLALPPEAFIDMGDFAGGLLKYLRVHPVPNVTIAGGFGKLVKLAQGAMDLHSARSQVDLDRLAELALTLGAPSDLGKTLRRAESAQAALVLSEAAGLPLAPAIAEAARASAQAMAGPEVAVRILVTNRSGQIVGESG